MSCLRGIRDRIPSRDTIVKRPIPIPIHPVRTQHGDETAAFWRYLLLLCALAPALLANYLYFGYFDINLLVATDSASYIGTSPLRTVGYSLFLSTLGSVNPGWVAIVQLNLYLASVIWLGASLLRLFAWPWMACVVTLMLAGHTSLQLLAMWQLSDSLFATLTIAAMTSMAYLVVRPSLRWALATSLLCGAAILVRPAGYYLLGVLVFLSLTVTVRRLPMHLALWLPVVGCLLSASLFNVARFGVFAPQVIGGYSLVGHVGEKIEPGPNSPHPQLAAAIQARLEPVLARRGAPEADSVEDDYNEILWLNVLPEIAAHVARTDPQTNQRVAMSEVAGSLARKAILDHPGWYVQRVASQLGGLVTRLFDPPARVDLEIAWAAGESNELLARSPRLSEQGITPSIVPQDGFAGPVVTFGWLANLPWVVLSAYEEILLVLLACATLVLTVSALRTRSSYSTYAAMLGLSVVGYLVLVSAMQIALYRYALMAVPATLLLVLFLLAGGITRLQDRRAR